MVATGPRPRFRDEHARGCARDSEQSTPALLIIVGPLDFLPPERSPPAAPAGTAIQRAACIFEGHSRWDFVFLGTVPRSAKSRPGNDQFTWTRTASSISLRWHGAHLPPQYWFRKNSQIQGGEPLRLVPHPTLRNLILRRRTLTGTASGASARLAAGRRRLRVAR